MGGAWVEQAGACAPESGNTWAQKVRSHSIPSPLVSKSQDQEPGPGTAWGREASGREAACGRRRGPGEQGCLVTELCRDMVCRVLNASLPHYSQNKRVYYSQGPESGINPCVYHLMEGKRNSDTPQGAAVSTEVRAVTLAKVTHRVLGTSC